MNCRSIMNGVIVLQFKTLSRSSRGQLLGTAIRLWQLRHGQSGGTARQRCEDQRTDSQDKAHDRPPLSRKCVPTGLEEYHITRASDANREGRLPNCLVRSGEPAWTAARGAPPGPDGALLCAAPCRRRRHPAGWNDRFFHSSVVAATRPASNERAPVVHAIADRAESLAAIRIASASGGSA